MTTITENKEDIMKALMKRNNTISLAILVAMLSFLGMMFTFMLQNNSAHTDLTLSMQKESQFTHEVYRWVITPNDSITKILILKVDDNRRWGIEQVRRGDSCDVSHNNRLTALELWRQSKGGK